AREERLSASIEERDEEVGRLRQRIEELAPLPDRLRLLEETSAVQIEKFEARELERDELRGVERRAVVAEKQEQVARLEVEVSRRDRKLKELEAKVQKLEPALATAEQQIFVAGARIQEKENSFSQADKVREADRAHWTKLDEKRDRELEAARIRLGELETLPEDLLQANTREKGLEGKLAKAQEQAAELLKRIELGEQQREALVVEAKEQTQELAKLASIKKSKDAELERLGSKLTDQAERRKAMDLAKREAEKTAREEARRAASLEKRAERLEARVAAAAEQIAAAKEKAASAKEQATLAAKEKAAAAKELAAAAKAANAAVAVKEKAAAKEKVKTIPTRKPPAPPDRSPARAKKTAAKKSTGKAKANPAVKARVTKDDLQLLGGVGPAMEKKLNAKGIRNFAQLNKLGKRGLGDLAESLGLARDVPTKHKWLSATRVKG
ncbi:MAG: putative flap endonuclease-1-like 5' DNA nuclease, partial [Planctomycetota bacterium]